MSVCRPLLSREVHVPKFVHRQAALRHTYAPPDLLNIKLSRWMQTRNKLTTSTTHSTNVSPLNIWRCFLSSTVSHQPKVAKTLDRKKYEELRARNPDLIANLLPASYLHVLSDALEHRLPDFAGQVILDILDHFKGTEGERRDMLWKVLSLDLRILKKGQHLKKHPVLRVLQHLHETSEDGLDFLDKSQVGGIGLMMLDSTKSSTDRATLRLLHPLLLALLPTVQRPKDVTANYPPSIVLVAFRAVYKLVDMSFDSYALELFQLLLNLGFLPVEAIPAIDVTFRDSTSADPQFIMLSALIKSCLHWNWYHLASDCMVDLLKSPTTSEWALHLNVDVIHTLLEAPTLDTIRACSHMIRAVHNHSPVPDTIIQKFYSAAASSRAKKGAEELYGFTREPRVHKTHRYPPPPNNVLPWLMAHLTRTSSQTHLARTLATEVFEDNLEISPPFRAQFIASVAEKGFGQLARGLWSRYAEGKDAGAVVGNSALMIRMVSLLWHVRNGARERLEGLEHPRNLVEKLQKQLLDASNFLSQVIIAYKQHHAPLNKAPHRDLTSLARAYFIIGKIPEGLRVFRILTSRNEVLDMHDVNVALGAVAQVDVRLAASFVLSRMPDLGLEPDQVSIGTVLHHAVLKGDREVMGVMIGRIRELTNGKPSLVTLTNMIHGILALAKNDSKEELRKKLDNILYLVESNPDVNLSSSSQMAKTLVYGSIDVEDGILAYRFWRMFLLRGAEWKDREQHALRESIARLIRQPGVVQEPGGLEKMLAKLGDHHDTPDL